MNNVSIFCSCPQSLDFLFWWCWCIFSLCFLCFSVLENSIEMSLSSEIPPSGVQSTIKPIKSIFISLTVFLYLEFLFCFFLRMPVSLLALLISRACWLSIRVLSLLIIVILNSWSDNSNIPSMSGSDACPVSSKRVYFLLICPITIFLRARHGQGLRPIAVWWEVWGQGKCSRVQEVSVF